MLNIPVKSCKTYALSDSGRIEVEQSNAMFVKGGAAYFAYDGYAKTTEEHSLEMSDMAPRTHDYDFTICVNSIEGLSERRIADFFWTAVKSCEHMLDLSSFVRIDKFTARSEYFLPLRERTILDGPSLDPEVERCPGGPSDYLTLTVFSNPKKKYINYRINAFLPHPSDITRISPYHIVEFIFTSSDTEFVHVESLNRIEIVTCLGKDKEESADTSMMKDADEDSTTELSVAVNATPFIDNNQISPVICYYIPVIDITSLLSYSIYAMLMRGFSKKTWRKTRQDYARIRSLINIINSIPQLSNIVDISKWAHRAKLFTKISQELKYCTDEVIVGYDETATSDEYFTQNFKDIDASNLIWYALSEIGFDEEAKPYDVTSDQYFYHDMGSIEERSESYYIDYYFYEDMDEAGEYY
jgi:hypothetical protein